MKNAKIHFSKFEIYKAQSILPVTVQYIHNCYEYLSNICMIWRKG